MDITKQYQEQQEAKQKQSKISFFIGEYGLGTLLKKSGDRENERSISADAILLYFHVDVRGQQLLQRYSCQ